MKHIGLLNNSITMGSLGIKVLGLNSDVLYRFTYLEHDKSYFNFSVSENDPFQKGKSGCNLCTWHFYWVSRSPTDIFKTGSALKSGAFFFHRYEGHFNVVLFSMSFYLGFFLGVGGDPLFFIEFLKCLETR